MLYFLHIKKIKCGYTTLIQTRGKTPYGLVENVEYERMDSLWEKMKRTNVLLHDNAPEHVTYFYTFENKKSNNEVNGRVYIGETLLVLEVIHLLFIKTKYQDKLFD